MLYGRKRASGDWHGALVATQGEHKSRSLLRTRSALVAILLLGAYLRVWGAGEVGLRYDDENAYLAEARLWHRIAAVVTSPDTLSAAWRGDRETLKTQMHGADIDFSATYDKPTQGYSLFCGILMFPFGERPAAALYGNAVCGLLTVWVIYGLGCAAFSRPVGLLAALMLAVSPYHLVYCRTAFPEATASLFITLAMLLWVVGVKRGWTARRTCGLSGVAMGIAMTCHFRHGYLLGVIALADAWWLWHSQRGEGGAEDGLPARLVGRLRLWLRVGALRILWLTCGFLVAPMCIESLRQAGRLVAWMLDTQLFKEGYLAQFPSYLVMRHGLGVAMKGRNPNWCTDTLEALGTYLFHWYGAIGCVLMVVGLAWLLRRRSLAKVALLAVVVTVLLASSQPYAVARALSAVVPALSLAMAVGAVWLAGRICRDSGMIGWLGMSEARARPARVCGVVLGLLMVGVGVPGLAHCWRLHGAQSDLPKACKLLEQQGVGVVAVSPDPHHHSKYWQYLEHTGVTPDNSRFYNLGPPPDVFETWRNAGVRWVAVDPQRWHYRETPPGPANRVYDWWADMDAYLAEHARLLAEFDHLSDYCWEFLADGPGLACLDEMKAGGGRSRSMNSPPPAPMSWPIARCRRGPDAGRYAKPARTLG